MKKIASALVLAAAAGFASASEVVNVGSFLQNDAVRNQNITGSLVGSGYTRAQVSVQWSAASGGPWSNEAIWALADNDITNATVFYADPGPAPNSASNGNAVTLTWSALLSRRVGASSPLWFLSLQTFAGSSANWNNVSVTFDTFAAPAPSSFINLGVVADDDDIFSLDTAGSDFDTEIGLFNDFGGLIASNDDDFPNLTSLIDNIQLEAGTYYFSVSGFNTNFNNDGFGAVPGLGSDGGSIGGSINGVTFSGSVASESVQWYSFQVVPTPGALSVLGLGALVAGRRRR